MRRLEYPIFNSVVFTLLCISITTCRTLYEIPRLCQSLKTCPCTYSQKSDIVRVGHCSESEDRDSAKFLSSYQSNGTTLIYANGFIQNIKSGSFDYFRIARIEVVNATNVATIEDDILFEAKVDSIKLSFDNDQLSHQIQFGPHAFRRWRKLKPEVTKVDQTCCPKISVQPWYNGFSKHCHGLELSKWSPLRHHTMLRPELFYELRQISRLAIDGDFMFMDVSNPFSSISELKHLELGGYVLANLTGQSLGSLMNLESIRLRKRYSEFHISPHLVRLWLSRKPNLKRIAVEEGLEILSDTFELITNPKQVTELSLRGSKIDQFPRSILLLESLKILDLTNTSDALFSSLFNEFSQLRNLTLIIIDSNATVQSECNCTLYGWMRNWTAYNEHGIDLFKSINVTQLISPENSLIDCLKFCNSSNFSTQAMSFRLLMCCGFLYLLAFR